MIMKRDELLKEDLQSLDILSLFAYVRYESNIEKHKNYSQIKGDITFGYTINENRCGILVLEKVNRECGNIKAIAVREAYRRQGIGRKMIDYSLEQLALKSLRVEADEETLGFYKRCGFQIEDIGTKCKGERNYICRFTRGSIYRLN